MMRSDRIAGAACLLMLTGLASTADAQATAHASRSSATRMRSCPPLTKCKQLAFDTRCDLALASATTGVQPAVARDVLAGFAEFHAARNVNDGKYGNGSAWVSSGAGSWIKIDLGKPTTFNSIRFGRDRLKEYADRQPGTVQVFTSLDDREERLVWSGKVGGDGALGSGETAAIDGFRDTARYVKLVFSAAGVAVDEIEVHDLQDGAGGGRGEGCWATTSYGPVPLRPATWTTVSTAVPAPVLAVRVNWSLGPEGPVAEPAPRWLSFGPVLPVDWLKRTGEAEIGSFFLASGTTPRRSLEDNEVARRIVWLRQGDLVMVGAGPSAGGEAVSIGWTGLFINTDQHPLCLVPVSPSLWFRPTLEYAGDKCPVALDGKLPIEPWILAPF